jgi:hypothetical protein
MYDRQTLEAMSTAALRNLLRAMNISARGARTKRELIERIMLEMRVRHDLAAIRNGARP